MRHHKDRVITLDSRRANIWRYGLNIKRQEEQIEELQLQLGLATTSWINRQRITKLIVNRRQRLAAWKAKLKVEKTREVQPIE